MKSVYIQVVALFLAILTIVSHAETTIKQPISAKNVGSRRCQMNNGQYRCFCGENKLMFNPRKGERCIGGQIVQKKIQKRYAS
jgi:hypothetical protein